MDDSKREPAWEAPKVEYLGTLAELVQGRGKSGPGVDGDPKTTAKGGL